MNKKKREKRPFISKLLIFILLVLIIYIYARYIGTTGIMIKEYNIVDDEIPASFDGFSIVQFSDLEIGSTFNLEDIDKLVEKINSLKPDIVVFTGDIISPTNKLSSKKQNELISKLKKIDPLIGKYAVRGDDDVLLKEYESLITSSGFKDISNSHELIYYKGLTPIVLYGLDSLTKGNQNFEEAFSYPAPDSDPTYMATYRILLAHEPDTANKISSYHISLMLSGHSHNNELNIPYIKDYYNIDGASDYYDEEYDISGMKLFISSGLGTSKFNLRLFSRPSISVYRLYID